MNIQDIMSKNIAVSCKTEEDADSFLEMADLNGYRWITGRGLIGDSKWDDYEEETCYCLQANGLTYCDIDYFTGHGYDIIDCSEFIDCGKQESFEVSVELSNFLNLFTPKPASNQ